MNIKNYVLLIIGIASFVYFCSFFNLGLIISLVLAFICFWYLDKQYNFTKIDDLIAEKIIKLWNDLQNK